MTESQWIEIYARARRGASFGNPAYLNADDREDCVQEAMLHAWKRHESGATFDELLINVERYARRRLYVKSTAMARERGKLQTVPVVASHVDSDPASVELVAIAFAEADSIGDKGLLRSVYQGEGVTGLASRAGCSRAAIYRKLRKIGRRVDAHCGSCG